MEGNKNPVNPTNKHYVKIVVLLLIGFVVGFAVRSMTTQEGGVLKENLENDEIKSASTTISSLGSKNGNQTTVENVSSVNPVMVKTLGATANNLDAGTILLSVADQAADSLVYVSKVTTDKDTWVAIREDNGNGELGNILGATLFFSGTKEDQKVALLRNTEAGKMYYVVLYADDGDRVFDFHKDELMKSEDGTIHIVKFRTY